MNRQNVWIHIMVAAIVITFAAVLGQFRNWETKLRTPKTVSDVKVATKPLTVKRSVDADEPEVFVKFRPEVGSSEIRKITAKNNDSVEDRIEAVKGLTSIDDLDDADAETVAAQYAAMTDKVLYAEANNRIELAPTEVFRPVSTNETNEAGLPNDPMFNEQWALNNAGQNGGKANAHLDALKAWAKTQGSSEVVVAVLDTGVDYTHPDLVSNMWMRPESVPAYRDEELGAVNDLRGFNAADNQGDPMDDNGHGTHCSGIVGAEGDNSEGIAGINWNVQIMPLKFLGRGGSGSTKDAIESINYAIDRKRNGVNVRVINASWGSTSKSKALEDVIRAAGEQGILFVAAAGNSSTNNDKNPHFPSNYNLPNVISVASLDRTDNLSSFSNFGAKTVHIAAPGREILSTWLGEDYREASGTSMATPYVAGTAALILSIEPDLSVEKLRERILKSVDKTDQTNGKVVSGGRLNAAKAILN